MTRSRVKIMISKEGYNLLKSTCIEANKFARELIENTDELKIEDNFVLIGWDDIRWYRGLKDVEVVFDVLDKLDKLINEDSSKLDNYFYKVIEIEENGCISEETNDSDGEFTGDFYVNQNFSL